jgi:hypothetical protein
MRALATAGVLLAIAVSPAASAASVEVSDERTETYWAHVAHASAVRSAPQADAAKLGRITRRTYHGLRDVVLVLRETEGWLFVRYPGLGTRTGWVPAASVGPRRFTDMLIVVERGSTRLRVLRAGRTVFRARVGVGAVATPTPPGRTYLRERVVPPQPGGPYGVLAFGLSSYSPFATDWPGGGQVGMHGTNRPELIPGFVSNGCIRLRNAAIRRLDRLAGVGTPVLVR